MLKLWFNKFVAHANNKNMKLLQDDIRFIKQVLDNVPEYTQRAALRQYCVEWEQGMADEDNEIKQQNKGRYRANCFLREFIKNI